MADIHFMYVVLMKMLQLHNVFIQQNFLIEEFPLLNCLKIFTNFVNSELAIKTLANLDVSIFNTENRILRITEENS